jgi:flagellar biosynthesis/type III secretory pathway protein FliH
LEIFGGIKMTKQEQIEEMAVIGCVRNPQAHTAEECAKCDFKQGQCNAYRHAEALYEAGYRKTFTSDLASDTQKAFKEGYEKARKETAKEIFQKVVNICRKEEDFQDGTVNTQLEPLYFGIMNGCAFIRGEVKELAKQYGVEVEE